MGLPADNKSAYDKGSVLNYIKGIPDEYQDFITKWFLILHFIYILIFRENRLLIVHGVIDENVFWKYITSRNIWRIFIWLEIFLLIKRSILFIQDN